MNAKEYLEGYKIAVGKIRRDTERIESIENVLKGVSLDGLPRGNSTGDPTKNIALNLIERKEKLREEKLEAERIKQEIASAIEVIPTERYRELLYSRYILRLSWRDVARRIDFFRPLKEYEAKSVMGAMHQRALEEFEKWNS